MMAMTPAQRAKRARDKKRGSPPRGRPKCGDKHYGAKAHRRRGEPVCDLCKESEREFIREYQADRRARKKTT